MRIATWNVNSLKARLERLEEWLAYAQPDVVCLQETKLADAAFPGMDIERMGYEWAHHGAGRWNGVALLSRVGIENVITGFDDDQVDPEGETRAITATCGGVQVTSVYVPNGRSLANEMYAIKLEWMKRLAAFVDRTTTPDGLAIVCGDYNIAPADIDVYNPKSFVDSTHTSADERKLLDAMIDWGMQDVFRNLWPQDKLYSWWDYRAGMFHKHLGMRIDLLLATNALAEKADFALMDRNARKGTSPSDHAPVFADFNL